MRCGKVMIRSRDEPEKFQASCFGRNRISVSREHPITLSEAARRRLLSRPGEPLFIADWDEGLMIHYEVDAELLQGVVPFELDLLDGRAFVSLVAFTMRGMR